MRLLLRLGPVPHVRTPACARLLVPGPAAASLDDADKWSSVLAGVASVVVGVPGLVVGVMALRQPAGSSGSRMVVGNRGVVGPASSGRPWPGPWMRWGLRRRDCPCPTSPPPVVSGTPSPSTPPGGRSLINPESFGILLRALPDRLARRTRRATTDRPRHPAHRPGPGPARAGPGAAMLLPGVSSDVGLANFQPREVSCA
jgi:hypothetical protein